MPKKTIRLSSQEDLKVFMSPQRQKLMRNMRMVGKPVTSKAVADMLGISTSSAQFHIKKLEKLGIVELSYTEKIKGIIAKYYRIADINVNIGTHLKDDLSKERYVIMQNLIHNTFDGLIEFYESGVSDKVIEENSEFINGFVNLTPADANELLNLIREFADSRQNKGADTQIWEYTLMLYNTGAADIQP